MRILSLVILIISLVFFAFVRRRNIVEWLVCACAEAEMTYGSGTGYLKLRDVYNEFVKAYPVLSVVVPFECFSALVDKALKSLKEKLSENQAISELVTGDLFVE